MNIEVRASDATVEARDDGSVVILVPLSANPPQHWRDLLEEFLRGHGSEWRWRMSPTPEVVLTVGMKEPDENVWKELRLLVTLVARTNNTYEGGQTAAEAAAGRIESIVRRWAVGD